MRIHRILVKIKNFLAKYWQYWTILAILAIVVYIGFVFYVYIYKPIYQPRELVPQKLEIDKKTYQQVIDFHNQQEEKINQIISKDYPDVFK